MAPLDRITVNPEQCGGKPCIRSMPIRVADVLGLLASGMTEEQVLSEYPDLQREDLKASLAYAAKVTLTAAAVHVLHHTRQSGCGDEDVKLIGVYRSAADAREAAERLGRQPGFRDQMKGFEIDRYDLNKDHWSEGFGSGD